MKQYETKKRKIISDYLNKHSDEWLSSFDIIEYLGGFGISKSAVYRNLSSLEREGKIRRLTKPNEKTAYFSYVACEHCKGKIHISCIKCGKTSHISSETAEYLEKSLKNFADFSLDKGETVLYGVCKDCKN